MGHHASVPNSTPALAPVVAPTVSTTTPATSAYCGMNISAATVGKSVNGNINLTSCNSALTIPTASLNTPPAPLATTTNAQGNIVTESRGTYINAYGQSIAGTPSAGALPCTGNNCAGVPTIQ